MGVKEYQALTGLTNCWNVSYRAIPRDQLRNIYTNCEACTCWFMIDFLGYQNTGSLGKMMLQVTNQLVEMKLLLLNSLLVMLMLMLHHLASMGNFVQAQISSSSFDFPSFTSTNNLILDGDALYMPSVSSMLLQPFYNGSSTGSNYSCAGLFYSDMIQMRSSSSTLITVASFSTSFTFSIANTTSAGMAFTFMANNHTIGGAGASLCLFKKAQNGNASNHVFAVEFDTWLNPEFDDPSNSHIGVNINSMNSTSIYDLCSNSSNNSCSFLNADQDFTCWIDYDSAAQTLDVFFTNGSTIQGISRPAKAIIHVPSLDLTDVFNDNMFVAITGSGAMYPEVKEIKSWSFKSGGGAPTPAIESRSGSKSVVGIIAGAVSAVCVLGVVILCIAYFVLWRPRDVKSVGSGSEEALSIELPVSANEEESNNQLQIWPREFSFQELNVATNGFSEDCLLGEGGFGQVFKGTFKRSICQYPSLVAVKRTKLKESNKTAGAKGFQAELSVISQIRHRNLVRLYGWCQEDRNLLLVFEYMPNRSLEKWLFGTSDRILTWQQRNHILTGVAAALAYLHEGWEQCILHRDIKAANVLLDEDFNPRVADFGLARIIDDNKMGRSTNVAGTYGYLAPETVQERKVTPKSDVYSFGILALEVVSGRRVLRMSLMSEDDYETDAVNLLECVWRARERGELLSVVDPRLGSDFHPDEMKCMFKLGLLCCHPDAEARPIMRAVHQSMVDGAVGQLVANLPPSKPRAQYFVGVMDDIVNHRNQRSSSHTSSSSARRISGINTYSQSNSNGAHSTSQGS